MGTPAEEFGPYLVYEQLGLGGMATVHRAEAKGIAGFSKQVALKRMLPSVAADASLVKSFIREARLASHLRHENVAQTYDLGKVGTTYFIAMELVPGRNLREILKHCAAVVGHMPLPIAMNIVNQICDALDYAHDLCDEMGQPLGIIHRDVSPANIIVSEGGVVKLIDFGIAKASARSGMQTMSGTIKGKFSYMAPEYLMGSIDARADLFALGVIAHELLANRPLFQGRDDMDTLYRVKDMPILPPSRINPKVPAEIDAIIMTALERDPEQRWQKAHALRMALTTETKRLGIVAHNSQVFEWINQAFTHTRKGTFEEDSEPVISISEGTSELPRAKSLAAMTPAFPRGTPHRAVPDDFSGSDGIQTIVKPVGKRPDEWHQQTDPTIDEMDRPVGGIPADDSGDWIGRTDFPTRLVRKSAQQAAAPDPQLIDTRRERSGPTPRPTPHTVARKTPRPFTPQPSDDNDTLPPDAEYPGELIDEDEIRTLPPRSDRSGRASTPLPQRPTPTPTRAERPSNPPPRPTPPRVDRPSQPPPRPTPPRTDRPSQPPGLAPRSDAQARTIMIDASAAPRPSQQLAVPTSLPLGGPAAPMPIGLAPTLDLPKAAAVVQLPSGALLGSPPPPQRMFVVESRATPNPAREARDSAPPPPVLPILTIPGPGAAGPTPGQVDARHARALLDDLAARGERPSAGKLLGQPAGRGQNTVMKTRIEPAKRSGASNFLLAVLVLIAAGGAAAVVYFALPYLT